jgi:diguanylate cyclase (GGDEF)-like protein
MRVPLRSKPAREQPVKGPPASSGTPGPETPLDTAYTWDIATDLIEWQPNAAALLGVRSLAEVRTGTQLQARMAASDVAHWRAAILDARTATRAVHGIPYRIQFKFMPGGLPSGETIWLEDMGRWWPGPDGRPARSRGVIRLIDERYLEEQRLLTRDEDNASTEELNRARLSNALGAVIGRAERTRQPSAFFMATVNNIDAINSSFGHDVGDEVIAAAARVLRAKLRGVDAIGRYGSNAFGIILHECEPGAMKTAAERLMNAVKSATIETSACPLSATISLGGVSVPDHAKSPPQAINNALEALEVAKQTPSSGGFVAFDPVTSEYHAKKREKAIKNSVITALEENRYLLVLQPIVDAKTMRPVLYEALLRMKRTDGTLVSAGEFIEEAEKLGLSRLLDRRTLELAIELLVKHPNLSITLNVSSLTTGDTSWLDALKSLTKGNPSLTQRVTVEITETAMIHDIDQAVAFVNALRKLGCGAAIDDFGAGYTSFRHLKVLNVDMLKIDGMFVKDLPNDHQGRVVVSTMIEVAKAFELKTVAEWVSDEETATFLREAGVTYLQGFYCGSPMTTEELRAKGLL